MNDQGRHVFGSFLSRELAYQLMISLHHKNEPTMEDTVDNVEEDVEDVEEDLARVQDVDVSSLGDSSSISGCESPPAFTIQPAVVMPIQEQEATFEREELKAKVVRSAKPDTSLASDVSLPSTVGSVGGFKVKLMSEFNILFIGICLTILLAIFSVVLLFKLNAIEERNSLSNGDDEQSHSAGLSIDDAEIIINQNILTVRNVRKRLEELQELLQNSFDQMPTLREKHEF
jgi:hypothetical protein